MIDIHCHILPDFDDGASSLEEALEMARMATYSGVTEIIATPHFRGEPDFLEQQSVIERHFRILESAAKKEDIPVRLHLGAEVLCLPETIELAERRQLPTLAGTDYVLTEFYFDESYAFMDETLAQIAQYGYKPVVAHPERYGVIQHDPRLLQRWVRLGYVLQLNKGSVLGSFGPRPEQAANEILGMGLAHLFASDAHSCHSRTPHMGNLRQWVDEFCEPEYAAILLKENPRRLIRNRPMVGADA